LLETRREEERGSSLLKKKRKERRTLRQRKKKKKSDSKQPKGRIWGGYRQTKPPGERKVVSSKGGSYGEFLTK